MLNVLDHPSMPLRLHGNPEYISRLCALRDEERLTTDEEEQLDDLITDLAALYILVCSRIAKELRD